MSKQFVKGNKYVFVAKKCKKDIKSTGDDWKKYERWINEINGRLVDVTSNDNALCNGYLIDPRWCKCVGSDNNE